MSREVVGKAYAAGILPFTRHKGKVLWLVAQDVRDGTYSDFGGKAEQDDARDLVARGFASMEEATAAREFLEETYGLALTINQLGTIFAAKHYVLLVSSTRAEHPYYCYVVQVPFQPHLRDAAQKLLGFLRTKGVYRAMVEKTDLRWVTTSELFGSLPKRHVFERTIQAHRDFLTSMERREWRSVVRERSGS